MIEPQKKFRPQRAEKNEAASVDTKMADSTITAAPCLPDRAVFRSSGRFRRNG
jgi:hypothetical protein